MKKFRLVLVAVILSAGLVTGCADDTEELIVDRFDHVATEGTGGNGSSGGDNPPPGTPGND